MKKLVMCMRLYISQSIIFMIQIWLFLFIIFLIIFIIIYDQIIFMEIR
jgi:hypothetical protein